MGFRNARRGTRPGETEELQAAIDAAAATAAAAQADADAAAAAAAAADAAAAAAQTDATAAQGTATDAQADAAAAAAAAAAAQADATAAADVAERKIRTFQGNVAPNAEGQGDLWLEPVNVGGVDYFLLHRATAPGTASWGAIAIMADKVAAGALDGETITGALIRTDDAGTRWELSSAAANSLHAFTPNASVAGGLAVGEFFELGFGWVPFLNLQVPPLVSDSGSTSIRMEAGPNRQIIHDAELHHFRDGPIQVGNSEPLSAIDFGSISATVAGGSGVARFTHALGVTPATVLPAIETPSSVREVRISAKAATTFDAQCRDSGGAVTPDGTVVTLGFVALV